MIYKGIIYLSFLILLYPACKPITYIKKMYAKEASFERWSNGDKTVVFIPMSHVSTPEFYADVKRIIDSMKHKNYTVYYEGTKKEKISDSTLNDRFERKLRKMLGFYMDSVGYAAIFHKAGIFKTKIDQPAYHKLGIDNYDHNVDVTINDIMEAYEKQYGEIKLEVADMQIPLRSSAGYRNSMRLPRKKVENIVVGFRNTHLSTYIANSSDSNIVIVYGLAHLKGTYENLYHLNHNWKKDK
jgi:hypothetical protein